MGKRFVFIIVFVVSGFLACPALLLGQEPANENQPARAANICFLDREKGEPDVMILELTESIEAAETPAAKAETAAKLGWLYLLYRSDSTTALQWFSQSVELDKKNIRALEGALFCDMTLGNHDGLAQRTCDIIEADPDSHVAMLYLRVLHNAMYITNSWNSWPPSKKIAFFEGLLARNLQNPRNESLVKSYLMFLKLGRRQRAEAFQSWKSLGCVDKWFVLGMFCPEGPYGFYEKLPPELEINRVDPSRKFTVDDVELRWTPVTITRECSYASLMRTVKNDGSCLFLATYINSPSERQAAIHLVTGQAFKLWLNGVLIHVSNKFENFISLREHVGTTLKEGLNLLVMKLCGTGEETSTADLTLVVTNPAGRPFEDLSFQNEFEAFPPAAAPSGKELEPVALNRTAKETFIEAWNSPSRTYSDYVGATYLLSEDGQEELMFQYEEECYDAHRDCALANLFMAFGYKTNPFLPAEQVMNQYRSMLEQAAEIDPAMAPAFFHLGDFYKEKDPDKAINFYKKAIALKPACEDAVLGLAGVFAKRNWEAEWFHLVDGLLQARPDCLRALSLLFDYYYDRLNLDKALALGDKIDELTEAPFHWHRAKVLARRGRFEESIAEWQRQIEENPEHPQAYKGLASLFADIGRTQDAIELYEKAIAADQHNCFCLHREIGNLWARQNDLDRAEAHWNKILSLPMSDSRMEKGKQYDQREADFADYRKKGTETLFADRYKVNTEEIIKNAPGAKEYPKAPMITLLLQHIVEFVGDDLKHAKHRTHFVAKILNKKGGERCGRIAVGQAMEECRVFLPDGRVLEADGVQEEDNLALPELDKDTIIELRRFFSSNLPFDLNACVRNVFLSPLFRFEQEPMLKAQLIIIMPTGAKKLAVARETGSASGRFFMRCRKMEAEPVVEEIDGRYVYTFNFENVNDYIPEPLMPPPMEILPNVRLFQWPFDFERLMRVRRSGHVDRRVALSVKAKAEELTRNVTTVLEKTKRVFDFVVREIKDGGENNPSQTLIEKRGPSQELFIAMLRGIGIETEYAYVMPSVLGPEEQKDWELQGPQFVAQLAAVNLAGAGLDDWLFLSVSQFSPFGAIPAPAEGGRAVVVRKDGVSIIPLPFRSLISVKGIHRADVTLSPDGKAICCADILLATFDSAQARVQTEHAMGEEQRKQMFQRIASQWFAGITLSSFEIPPFDPLEGHLHLKFEGTTNKFVAPAQEGWQFKVTTQPKELARKLSARKDREFPMRIRYAVTSQHLSAFDDMCVRAPEGYEFVAPSDIALVSQFGYYTLSFRMVPETSMGLAQAFGLFDEAKARDSVLIERRFLLYDQDIAPDDFEKFMAFLKRIDHAERMQVAMRKK
jgi:tetratricopeptide (TPR) repeat protein